MHLHFRILFGVVGFRAHVVCHPVRSSSSNGKKLSVACMFCLIELEVNCQQHFFADGCELNKVEKRCNNGIGIVLLRGSTGLSPLHTVIAVVMIHTRSCFLPVLQAGELFYGHEA